MKKLVAVIAIGAVVIAASAPVAEAHGGAALALGAFAAFTTLVTLPFLALAHAAPVYPYPAPAYTPAYYAAPPVSYAPPAVSYAPPAPAVQREVVYAHGRHVLYGDGVRTAYQWVWVPNAPPPPPTVPPPPAGTPPPPPPSR